MQLFKQSAKTKNYSQSFESGLINKVKKGDQTAFEPLLTKYYPKIYNYCYSILKNNPDADDAAQETFIAVLTTLTTKKLPTLSKFPSTPSASAF